jgi:hypothetical protein
MYRAHGCVDVRLAGVQKHYLCPPKDINMRIPHEIVKCVGFISHDQPKPDYLGTVFLVGVQAEDDPTYVSLHLVTAKHVAELIDPGPFVIGMNAKDGAKLLLRSGDARWWYHPTEKDSVDVAVTPFCPMAFNDYDIEWIPPTVFATDVSIQDAGIGLGDEVFTVGLFTKFSGASRFEPLVRIGNIGMMPADPIPLKGFGKAEAYLIESRSIGGISGSPVFVRPSAHINTRTAKGEATQLVGMAPGIQLLGLTHGHWDLPLKFKEAERAEALNMGVAIVIPAKKILETLYHPELVQMRKDLKKQSGNDNLPVTDTASPKVQRFTKDDFDAALKKVSRKISKKK